MLYVFLFLLLFPLVTATSTWIILDKEDADPAKLNLGYAVCYFLGTALLTFLTLYV